MIACCVTPWLLCLGLAGCGSDQSAEVPEAEASAELDLGAMLEPAEPQQQGTASPVGMTARPESLRLRLRPGQRFPMVKEVRQQLVQQSQQLPARADTRLELHMVITVEEVASDSIRMHVGYTRAAYEHDINGRRLEWDSATHQGVVPSDARPYAGMVGNGFRFVLGRDNRIREVLDYKEFLERCVRFVPPEQRPVLMADVSNRFGDDSVANFVDDTIGLLPYDSSVPAAAAAEVREGDLWTRRRKLMQPVPVYLNTTYRLARLNPETAEIDIAGKVVAAKTYEQVQGSAVASRGVRIDGGESLGTCIVDRASGLPLEVSLNRTVRMTIRLVDGSEVGQTKLIRTSIRAFPETGGPTVRRSMPRRPVHITDAAAELTSHGQS